MCLNGLKKKLKFISPFCDSEKEAEKLKERLAQEEAEAMEMEDEENKNENANNVKEVSKKSYLEACRSCPNCRELNDGCLIDQQEPKEEEMTEEEKAAQKARPIATNPIPGTPW